MCGDYYYLPSAGKKTKDYRAMLGNLSAIKQLRLGPNSLVLKGLGKSQKLKAVQDTGR